MSFYDDDEDLIESLVNKKPCKIDCVSCDHVRHKNSCEGCNTFKLQQLVHHQLVGDCGKLLQHGRLIDADRLKNHYALWCNDELRELFDTIIDLQPTILEAYDGS